MPKILTKITAKSILRVYSTVILERALRLKSDFEKKLSVWQNLRNTFKNLKNHL